MNQEIRSDAAKGLEVAIIGLGRMGVRHVQAVQQLGMRVVGVTDVSAAAVDSACASFGIDRAFGFTDATEMLRRVRPAALAVATTAPTHAEFVLAAVEHGVRHILAEKPMACSLEQADRMITACAAHGVQLAVNHQMRFMAQYTKVKALVGSDALGPLASIVVSGSNFGLAMNASHYFEAFRFVAGEDVNTVRAWLEPDRLVNPRGAQFDDRSGRLLVQGASGISMYIDFSAAAGWGLQVTYICRNGQITVDELQGNMRVAARDESHRALPTTRYGMPALISEHTIAAADTVAPTMAVWAAMLAGHPFPDGVAGRHALACVVAAHESHAQGGSVTALDALPLATQTRLFAWA